MQDLNNQEGNETQDDGNEFEDNLVDAKIEETDRSFFGKLGLFFLELVKIAVLAGVTIMTVRYFLFKPFSVLGQSMEPNFVEKDYLIIDELSYRFREPERGEVVVFRAPVEQKDYYLKRIVGLPGERIKIEENKVIVFNREFPQGKVVDEVYLTEKTDGIITVSLGKDQYFVMGDNRDSSFDSRKFGPIDKDALVGRVLLRGWPFSRFSFFEHPVYNL